MKTRYFAIALGVVFIVVGILGFVPALLAPPEGLEPLAVGQGYGLLFGLFPVNIVHNAVHLAFGVWGLVAWRSFMAARIYARSVAVIYAVVAVMGLIPLLSTTFGLAPLFGHDIWLHAAIAIVAAYFGYASVTTIEASGTSVRRP